MLQLVMELDFRKKILIFPKWEALMREESPLEVEIICAQNGALKFQILLDLTQGLCSCFNGTQ